MDVSRAVARSSTRTRPLALTPGDRAALARFGRPGLIKRLRIQITMAWSAVASTLVVGFPLMMSEDYAVSDTGVIITMLSVPAMVVAAQGQTRMNRVRSDDPTVPAVTTPDAVDMPELTELAAFRGRVGDLVVAIRDAYPDVAAAMTAADAKANASLTQQARALASLADADDDATVAAREEIHARVQAGLDEYRHLIAHAALLLARSDAHVSVDEPLRSAADLAATYSEGIRISEESGR